jgi:hypothetical protein
VRRVLCANGLANRMKVLSVWNLRFGLRLIRCIPVSTTAANTPR